MSADSELTKTAANLRQEADYLDDDATQAEGNARRNVDAAVTLRERAADLRAAADQIEQATHV